MFVCIFACLFVYKVCIDFWYGEDCDKTCNCKNHNEICDKRTGRCTTGCPNGWTGDACDQGKKEYRGYSLFIHSFIHSSHGQKPYRIQRDMNSGHEYC